MGPATDPHRARVDPSTGYRYYSAEQAALVQRIVALEEFGFRLAHIGSILADPPSTEVIAGMLTMGRDEADADRRRAVDRVRAIEAELRVLDRSTEMINAYDDGIVVSRPESEVKSAVHLGDVAEMAPAYAALMEWLEARSLRSRCGAAEISLVWDPEHPDRDVTELQISIA